jgi:hypothetical protein
MIGAPQAGLLLPMFGCHDSRRYGEGLGAAASRHDDFDRRVVADDPDVGAPQP